MKLKEIHRTATFAWSPLAEPMLASGTVAGALDESFSSDSQLEIWSPNFMDKLEYDLGGIEQSPPAGSINTSSRFNRLSWGLPNLGRSMGILAAGMENGELGLWDPEKIVNGSSAEESLILRNTTHQGSVRGLDFNPIQTNLLSSGAVNGEIYIWDLKDPSKPYSPGTRSSRLDEITSLAWNRQVQYVLASASSTGFTVVWDLRNKREVVALAYGGANQNISLGGRKGISDVAWHPDNATRLVTSSEDDSSPVVMVWDLRNARAPEKILTGHEKGVLSLSWCRQDADLLLSCGKDNRALCWNPQSAEVVGELPYAANWAFQVQWCPRNPDLLATANFDGSIGVHSIQTTNEAADAQAPAPTPKPDGSDVFDVPGFARTSQPTLSLKQPPKWLRRPIASSFGYGGNLVTVSNLPSAQGKNQSSVVHLRKVVTEPEIINRAKKLKEAMGGQSMDEFARTKAEEAESRRVHDYASWKALSSLYKADSREELITLLGFSKDEIATRVAEAIEKLKTVEATPTQAASEELNPEQERSHEPVVSFAEPEADKEAEIDEPEHTPSEVSGSATSDHTDVTKAVDGESTTTAPSLFGDEAGTPQMEAEADFFSTIGTIPNAVPTHMQIPHTNYGHDSSVAATIGSRPSSAASEVIKNNTFRIYPPEESNVDRLVTKALVLGDFTSAVKLCLSAERFADAILLSVKGGPDLLKSTQQTYFEKCTTSLPYLRLYQSIVTEDLDDIVQNADLQDWREIFVVLCTFAKPDEFAGLTEQLGQRLEFHANMTKGNDGVDAGELRKHATLTYLAAGGLEKVVNIWIEEMVEEESSTLTGGDEKSSTRYSAHACALQNFMEKVAIFRDATKYQDADISVKSDPDTVRTYKLSNLYERYFEYADLLATQGLLKEAIEYLKLVPSSYQCPDGTRLDFAMARDRLLHAAGTLKVARQPASQNVIPSSSASTIPAQSNPYGYPSYAAPATRGPQYASFNGGITATPASVAVPTQASNPYAPVASAGQALAAQAPVYSNPYAPATTVHVPAPPPPIASTTSTQTIGPPPPPKRDNSGWNDAPVPERRTPISSAPGKAAAITSPFPNATPPSIPGSPMQGSGHALPPPPRPGSVGRALSQGPPPQGRPPLGSVPPNMYAQAPPRQFSPSQQPPVPAMPPPPRGPPNFGAPPPGRVMTPPHNQMQGPPRQTPPPMARGQSMGGPSPYARGAPSGWNGPGGGVPPPPQIPGPQTGPYDVPPGASQRPGPPLAPPSQMTSPISPPQAAPSQSRPSPAKQQPRGPKYPPGDRSHIPPHALRSFQVLDGLLNGLRPINNPQDKDIERRLNTLFDALNCETVSKPVIDQLDKLTEAMETRRKQDAFTIHQELLATGSRTDDIGIWMFAIKQLIARVL